MGKTRDLCKKIGDTRAKFHAKMSIMKYRNGKDLTEAEEIKRGGNNTQRNYIKKSLNDSCNHDGVVTKLEPDILECDVK